MSKEEIRSKIDAIDAEMLRLLNERGKLAKQVSQFKKVYYDPDRERQIFERLATLNTGPLMNEHITAIYREILSVCRNIQKPVKVAFLGPRATFSHSAAIQAFGKSFEEHLCPDIPAVFSEVEKENAEYGIVPFENSSEGVVNMTIDRFAASPVKICGELFLSISQCLLSNQDSIAGVKQIFTQSKAYEQCAKWLREKAPGIEIIQVASTGLAAQMAASQESAAAIGSAVAAEVYGLNILERGLEDGPNNATRFMIISKHEMPRGENDKTSLLFSVRHEPGTLYRALKSFERYNINLTMMQSRPAREGTWEYIFFVDLAGHCQDDNVKAALREMKKETIILKTLGSYPSAS